MYFFNLFFLLRITKICTLRHVSTFKTQPNLNILLDWSVKSMSAISPLSLRTRKRSLVRLPDVNCVLFSVCLRWMDTLSGVAFLSFLFCPNPPPPRPATLHLKRAYFYGNSLFPFYQFLFSLGSKPNLKVFLYPGKQTGIQKRRASLQKMAKNGWCIPTYLAITFAVNCCAEIHFSIFSFFWVLG